MNRNTRRSYTKHHNKLKKRTKRTYKYHNKNELYVGGNLLFDENPTGGRRHKTKTNGVKPMNCNPKVKGKTIDKKSCITQPILQKLKESYNTEYPATKITSTDPQSIWLDLKNRMSNCKREDCWLNVIKDPTQRQKIDKELFAPDMPEEWKKKPNAWLSNFDIIAVLEQYQESHPHFKILGPTPIDFDTRPPEKNGRCVWEELCTFSLQHYLDEGKTKIGIVFNLDKHNQGGSHWISLFLDWEHKFIFFLDSAGETMPKEVKALVGRIVQQGKAIDRNHPIAVYENHPTEHQMGNTECGVYCLFFIITMLTSEIEDNRIGKKKFKSAMEKIKFFKETKIPDEYVEKYRKKFFNEG
uniref:Ubiquitin-like protease family profile domain-containing protein n=1 Tax=viral metagenome TaxID=1070528 RepID=A0A6C0D2L6_9ZZZZ